jgi:Tfp pilus assembly protein PilP
MKGAKAATKLIAALALALWLVPATGVHASPAQGNAKNSAPASGQPAAPSPAQKPAAQAGPAKTPAQKSGSKAAKPPVEKPAAAAALKPEELARKRDPFLPLVNVKATGPEIALNLPPGKAGLQISTIKIDGTVNGPNGMIAVASNPQKRVYFIREGDHLYDGRVERISMGEVVFQQVAKDAFGKPVERQVSKRIYPTSAGESQ